MKNKKIAILFYGLTRSLSHCIHSLNQNLFTPLIENCIDFDVFIHENRISGEYYNPWANEYTQNYYNEDVETLLQPKYYIYDDQEKIVETIPFHEYYTQHTGGWTNNVEKDKYVIKNLCLALFSKKQITKLFDQQHISEEYDYAIIIRPDTELHSKIDVNFFNELNDNNIIIPEKHCYAGCNDRICIGKPHIISYCGKLFDELKSYSEQNTIISERFFQDKLKEKQITILSKKIEYVNIRINGTRWD